MRDAEAAEFFLIVFILFRVCATFASLRGEKSSGCELQHTVAPSREEIFVHATHHTANDRANDSVSVFIHL